MHSKQTDTSSEIKQKLTPYEYVCKEIKKDGFKVTEKDKEEINGAVRIALKCYSDTLTGYLDERIKRIEAKKYVEASLGRELYLDEKATLLQLVWKFQPEKSYQYKFSEIIKVLDEVAAKLYVKEKLGRELTIVETHKISEIANNTTVQDQQETTFFDIKIELNNFILEILKEETIRKFEWNNIFVNKYMLKEISQIIEAYSDCSNIAKCRKKLDNIVQCYLLTNNCTIQQSEPYISQSTHVSPIAKVTAIRQRNSNSCTLS
jgi:hypothetical protein